VIGWGVLDDDCGECGASYAAFRTGLTFSDVSMMMFVGDSDPETWRNRGRHGVLGYWRELKLGLWALHRGGCGDL